MTTISKLDIIFQNESLLKESETILMKMVELRLLTGLSQRQFARKYHINFRTIQNCEQGISTPPDYVIEGFYRLISELDYKDTFVQNVWSDTYNIGGKMYLLKNNHYMLTFYIKDTLYCRVLHERKYIVDKFRDDYAWMSLENAYEDIVLNGG